MSFRCTRAVGLYVHIPFCGQRCAYCDFNTYSGLNKLMPAYVKALCREIELRSRHWGPLAVSTVYLGGGTPSLLSLDLLGALFGVLRAAFDVAADPEITIEANPETVTLSYLGGLRALGINRLSLGVQSTCDEELQMLGRRHTWDDVMEAVESARGVGFRDISLDLMYGLPGQAVRQWEETLRAVLELRPEHLSLYGLTLEEGTPLAEQVARNMLPVLDEERAALMYELSEEILAEAGFFHYEISNWAKASDREQESGPFPNWWPDSDEPDLEPPSSERISRYVCTHNLTYWRNRPWLGVGAGAHSWLEGRRSVNVKEPQGYVAAWEAEDRRPMPHLSTLSESVEEIDRPLEMGETMMLGLRLAEGVSNNRFESRFGEPLVDVYGGKLAHLQELGLLAWDGSTARLTRRGRLLGNRVFVEFI